MADFNGPGTCRVLLIYPRFSAATFWNYSAACEMVGARYPAAPLGLITLAATVAARTGTSAWSIAIPRNLRTPTSIGPTW